MAKETTPKEVVRLVDYSKDLNAAILSVEKDGQKLKHKIHNVALSIITAWGKEQITDQEPADYFNKLAAAAGYHGKALANWIALKTPLAFSDENEKWYVPVGATVNGETFKAARDEPFWEVSPPPKPTPFNAIALLQALLDRNQKKAQDPAKLGADDKLLDPALVRGIREMLAGKTE